MGARNASAFRMARPVVAHRTLVGRLRLRGAGWRQLAARAAGSLPSRAAAAALLAVAASAVAPVALLAVAPAADAAPTDAAPANAAPALPDAAACPAGLVEAVRAATGSDACVTARTRDLLVERGWAAAPWRPEAAPEAAPASVAHAPGSLNSPEAAPSTDIGALTQAEKKWLAANPVIRVAYEARPPLEHAGLDPARLGGLAGAYAKRLAGFTGAEFAVSYTSDWTETVEAIAQGRADMAFMAVDTGEQPSGSGGVGFTEPHTVLPSHLITLGIDGGAGGGFGDASPDGTSAPPHTNATLGLVRGHSASEWIAKALPDADVVPLGDHAEAFGALRSGRIDYLVEAWPVAAHAASELGVKGMRSEGHSGHYEHLSIAFSLGNPELRSILSKALRAMPDSDRLQMLADVAHGSRGAPPGGQAGAPPALSPDSLAWLEKNPIIRVAYGNWPPLEYADEGGRLGGLAAAYAARFAEYTGASFEPVHTHGWTDALASVLDGRADVAFMAVRTDGLLRHMGFTDPHTILPWDMITIGPREISVEDMRSLSVGTVRGYAIESWLDEKHPEIDYASFDRHERAFDALKSGRIDVLIESWHMASQLAAAAGVEGLHDSGPVGHHMHLSVGYARSNTAIAHILEGALGSVTERDRHQMLADALRTGASKSHAAAAAAAAAFAPAPAPRPGTGAASGAASLTAEEAAWLENNPVIRIAYMDWPPLEYAGGDGMLRGLTAEYIERFEAFTGADLVAERTDDRTEFVASIADGSAHAAFMVPATDSLRRHMGFTEPHTVLTWDIVTLGAHNYTADDLPSLSVGTIRGHNIEAWLDARRPDIEYVSIDGHEFAFEALLSGRIDVLVETWPVARLAASEFDIAGLRNSGSIGPELDLSVAFTKRQPELESIFSKALASIPQDDRLAMLERAVGGGGGGGGGGWP